MKKVLSMILVLALCCALFAGCSSSQSNGEATESDAPVTSGNHVQKDPFTENVKIAYVPNTGSSANAQAWGVGIRNILEPLNEIYGTIEFNVFDPNGSNETQVSILADLVTQGYDALIIQCVDSSAIVPSIEECKDAGMAVISLNVSPNCAHAARFGFGGYKNGYSEGLIAGEMLGGKGNVVIVGVPPEVTQAVVDCPWEGFKDALKTFEGITVLEEQAGDFTAESGNEIMRDFLSMYDQIDLAWCSNDTMAAGAALAIQSAGREGIAVWGSDGETQALEYIEQGLITGTLYNNPYNMGEQAASMALYCIASAMDQNLQANDYAPSIFVPSTVVTAENVATITERW